MLTDRQSLILCGLLVIGIFATGVLNILNNFITKTILVVIFLAIIVNIIVTHTKKEEEKE